MSYRDVLYEVAVGQNGYVTTDDVRQLAIPPVQLRLLAGRSGLTHVARGLYRFNAMPSGPHDEFMEAVLRVGPDAYLTHDAVLALHGLALVNPIRIRVGTSKRSRRQQPKTIEVVWRTLAAADLTCYEGIPSATVRRAIIDCRPLVMAERLIAAIDDALAVGLLRSDEVPALKRYVGQ